VTQATSAISDFEHIQLPDVGSVTLATLDQLRQAREQEDAAARSVGNEAAEANAQMQDRYADIGALLVPAKNRWPVPTELAPDIERVEQLVGAIKAADARLADLNAGSSQGLSGVFSRVKNWGSKKELQRQRARTSADLRSLLVGVGQRGAPLASQSIPALGPMLEQAAAAAAAESQKTEEAQVVNSRITALDSEIRRRLDAEHEMGFDALYTSAYMKRFGAPAVTSPLELKKGESAWFVCPAVLARIQSHTQFVGSSSGFSFPIGHTGIRYRVGSFRGHPIQQKSLTRLDTGTLVVTSQRLAFVGQSKSVAIQLTKVMHVEAYTDAVAVLHEGKENADYFLTTTPKQTVFYINWALNSAAA
jgi:hypothetical protein